MSTATQTKTTEAPKKVEETKRSRRRRLMARILADASNGAARYVRNFDAGRGGE